MSIKLRGILDPSFRRDADYEPSLFVSIYYGSLYGKNSLCSYLGEVMESNLVAQFQGTRILSDYDRLRSYVINGELRSLLSKSMQVSMYIRDVESISLLSKYVKTDGNEGDRLLFSHLGTVSKTMVERLDEFTYHSALPPSIASYIHSFASSINCSNGTSMSSLAHFKLMFARNKRSNLFNDFSLGVYPFRAQRMSDEMSTISFTAAECELAAFLRSEFDWVKVSGYSDTTLSDQAGVDSLFDRATAYVADDLSFIINNSVVGAGRQTSSSFSIVEGVNSLLPLNTYIDLRSTGLRSSVEFVDDNKSPYASIISIPANNAIDRVLVMPGIFGNVNFSSGHKVSATMHKGNKNWTPSSGRWMYSYRDINGDILMSAHSTLSQGLVQRACIPYELDNGFVKKAELYGRPDFVWDVDEAFSVTRKNLVNIFNKD